MVRPSANRMSGAPGKAGRRPSPPARNRDSAAPATGPSRFPKPLLSRSPNSRRTKPSLTPGAGDRVQGEVLRKPIEYFIRQKRVTEWAQFGKVTSPVDLLKENECGR